VKFASKWTSILALGVAVTIPLSLLSAERLDAVGQVWGAAFRVLAIAALAAFAVSLLNRRVR
jgi:hypothetical protein